MKHRLVAISVISFLTLGFLFFKPAPALAATATWTNSSGDGLWSNCNNWTIGGTTGTCPGNSDFATFNNTTGSDTNVAIDTNISVGNITVAGTYTKTITQNANSTITIWSGGYSQAGGTFTGGTNAISINNGAFNLTGGTFTNTSGGLNIDRGFNIGSATFNNTSKTVTLTGAYDADDATVTATNAIEGNLTINKTHASSNTTIGGDVTVQGNFTRTDGPITNPASARILTVQGNFSTTTTDAFGGTNLTVVMGGSGTQTITQNTNGADIDSVFQINKSGGTASLSGSNTFTVTGAACSVVEGVFNLGGLNFACTTGFTVEDGGTLQLYGSESPTTPTLNSSSTVTYTGDGDSAADTYSLANWSYSNLTVNSTDGTTDTFNLANNFTPATTTFTAGTIGTNGATTLTASGLITVGGATWNPGSLSITANGGITCSSGTFSAGSATIDINGTLTISGCTMTAPSGTITVSGNFAHSSGTFTHNSGTVSLDGTSQQITGSSTFNNLTKSVTSADTLTFGASDTQTIAGTLTLNGASGQRLSLRSTSTGTQWKIDPQGTRTLSYLDVKDSNNINSSSINAAALTDVIDSGNNNITGWVWNQASNRTGETFMKQGIYATVKVKGMVLYCAAFKRGGNWNNGANAGAFTLNLNNTPGNTNTNIGFRCASDHIPRQNVWCKFTDLHPGFTMITELFPLRLKLRRNIEPVFLYASTFAVYLVNRIGFYLWDEYVSPQSFAVSALKRAHAVTYYV